MISNVRTSSNTSEEKRERYLLAMSGATSQRANSGSSKPYFYYLKQFFLGRSESRISIGLSLVDKTLEHSLEYYIKYNLI
jgi:hypothetical protein